VRAIYGLDVNRLLMLIWKHVETGEKEERGENDKAE
jgi:hypothetical protein